MISINIAKIPGFECYNCKISKMLKRDALSNVTIKRKVCDNK